MFKLFTRTIEDFTCERCGREAKGNGYTNHCPHCLWSKHVDKNPGDRRASCGGLMEPSAGEKRGKDYLIIHTCVKCGFSRNNTLQDDDSFAAFVEISRRAAEKMSQGM